MLALGGRIAEHHPAYAQIQLQKGNRLGHRLQTFKEDIDRPLAAILTLNTIAHTVGAIGVGDQASKIWVDAHPLITGLLVPATMTLAILVLSELIPKPGCQLLAVLGLYDCAIADLDYSPIGAAGLVLSAHHQQTEKERCGQRLQPQRLFSDGRYWRSRWHFRATRVRHYQQLAEVPLCTCQRRYDPAHCGALIHNNRNAGGIFR